MGMAIQAIYKAWSVTSIKLSHVFSAESKNSITKIFQDFKKKSRKNKGFSWFFLITYFVIFHFNKS